MSRFPSTISDAQLMSYDTYLFDADGVLWRESETVPGAVDFVTKLVYSGKKVFIVTNNSTKTTAQYAKKTRDLGFSVIQESNIVSPNVVLVDYIKTQTDISGKNVYLIGSKAVKESLETGAGVKCFGIGPDPMPEDAMFLSSIDVATPAAAVVVGYDPHFSYPKIMKAANYLSDHSVHFFITNEDYTFPVPDAAFVVPGTGCLSAAVRLAVLPRQPTVFGKPGKPLSDYLQRTYNINPQKTIMFGDRLDTDIKFGNDNGFATCWMPTGVHSAEDVQRAIDEKTDPNLVPAFTYTFPC